MKLTIMTLFKETIDAMLAYSIVGRAKKNNYIAIEAVDIRPFANNKHLQVDDYPYGGGAGMLMMAQPIYDCYQFIKEKSTASSRRVIYVTPQGKVWNQKMAEEFSKEEEIVVLCGHYEGVDQRVIDEIVTDEISIGDYVLTGGELAALVITDSIIRLIPGVLGKEQSFEEESFSDGLLEYPQYTRPAVFRDRKVPDILLSGNHQKIAAYRKEQAIINTFHKRPDLLELADINKSERHFIDDYIKKHCKKGQDVL
ncbi:tRNA (guanosine(37)-N1)-methyltransferase TrmD [Cellulosilyticum sp. I15G10I2]|uniref:tRNA (guanosine(37)-N1)-methyltransferase TrmD n=1 Tax=Cellulosilyticum sp. I15G10I2 TaxID=1892843 RepID=UPI00085C33E4|nr:tRNA (guanosine(37)-N1)-methyltransferase TrmD [Cellulosilyticum sp. I15G10I2]